MDTKGNELLIEEAREAAVRSALWDIPHLLFRLVDALEATVPVQGEPNDREALSVAIGGVLFNVMNFPAAAQSRLLGQDMRPLRYTLEDAVLEAGFSRATVPDAATLQKAEAKIADLVYENASLKAERDAALAEIESRIEDRDYWYGIANIAKSQRDAALAAIERVRDILNRDDFGDDWEHDEWVYRQAAEKQLADIEDVLDGAPEPEEKP